MLYFCYEFNMVMIIIASCIILPSISTWLYVFLSILYLGIEIKHSNSRIGQNLSLTVLIMMIVLSIIFFIFKIILSVIYRNNSVNLEAQFYLSFGVAVKPGILDPWDITKTFLPDIVAIGVSIALCLGSIITRKNSINEFDEENIENMKVTGARSPSFWIAVYTIYWGLAGIISPSIFAFIFSGNHSILILSNFLCINSFIF